MSYEFPQFTSLAPNEDIQCAINSPRSSSTSTTFNFTVFYLATIFHSIFHWNKLSFKWNEKNLCMYGKEVFSRPPSNFGFAGPSMREWEREWKPKTWRSQGQCSIIDKVQCFVFLLPVASETAAPPYYTIVDCSLDIHSELRSSSDHE